MQMYGNANKEMLKEKHKLKAIMCGDETFGTTVVTVVTHLICGGHSARPRVDA